MDGRFADDPGVFPPDPDHVVSPGQVTETAGLIGGWLAATPLLASPALAALCGRPVQLKCEGLQRTGSFAA
ncbi:MAG: hypothetical protein FJ125_02725 [Deltaproteobacteria bacterium]|nr:hypothetical protein [Deltaproteobacteria bacterium]